MASRSTGVKIHGLRELRRDLKAIDAKLPRQVGQGLRQAVEKSVIPPARMSAPVVTGRLAASLKPFNRTTSAGVRSALPYAGPIHWGWAAHGIEPNPFIQRAAESHEAEIVEAVSAAIDELARRNGFH